MQSETLPLIVIVAAAASSSNRSKSSASCRLSKAGGKLWAEMLGGTFFAVIWFLLGLMFFFITYKETRIVINGWLFGSCFRS